MLNMLALCCDTHCDYFALACQLSFSFVYSVFGHVQMFNFYVKCISLLLHLEFES